MNDEIFLKSEKGGIWEDNPTIANGIYFLIVTIIFFPFYFLWFWCQDNFIALSSLPSGILFAINFILVIIYFIIYAYLALKANQRHNMSKSTAFIKRNNKLYAIQLLHTKKKLGTETSKNFVYGPADLNAENLSNNLEVAANVQTHEKEVIERRKKPESFMIALDDILEYLNAKPRKYHVMPDKERSYLNKLLRYNIENNGFTYIETKSATYNFLILDNPKIIDQNIKTFTVTFENEKNEQCTARFSNCYGNIIEEIANMSLH